MSKIIDGRIIAEQIKAQLKQKAANFEKEKGRKCGLAVILVGNDPSSEIYVLNKIKACEQVGINSFVHTLKSNVSQEEVCILVNTFNNSQDVDGILVQLPLPEHMDQAKILECISPKKDVDGFSPASKHIPCTALACLELIKSTGASLEGAHAVIIGRSHIVGRPVAKLLLDHDCTVTITHSKTRDLATLTRQADILISAVGKKELVTAKMVKRGAIVIDVGITRQRDVVPNRFKIFGDVDFDRVKKVASHITPVPGGVGPVTIAMLLSNVLS